METIEPIQFEAEGRGFDIDENYNPRLTGIMSEWDETHDFLFNNIVGEYFDEISRKTIRERYTEIVKEEVEPIEDISPTLVEMLSPESPTHEPDRPSSLLYMGEESLIIPNSQKMGIFYIVSNNKDRCRSIRNNIINDFENSADNYIGLGLENVNVSYGEDFSKNVLLEKDNVTEVSIGEPDEFEQEIYEKLEPISEAFISNVNIDFGNYDANPECDMILPLSTDNNLHIEVKDYSGNDNEPTGDDIIDQPLKRAELLDAGLTITVVKGVDESKLGNFQRSAELRDSIEILEKNDLIDEVKTYLESTTPQTSMNRFGWHLF